MSGLRVSLAAEIYTRPDIADPTPYLAQLLKVISMHRTVTQVGLGPRWSPAVLTFDIWISGASTPDYALLAADPGPTQQPAAHRTPSLSPPEIWPTATHPAPDRRRHIDPTSLNPTDDQSRP